MRRNLAGRFEAIPRGASNRSISGLLPTRDKQGRPLLSPVIKTPEDERPKQLLYQRSRIGQYNVVLGRRRVIFP